MWEEDSQQFCQTAPTHLVVAQASLAMALRAFPCFQDHRKAGHAAFNCLTLLPKQLNVCDAPLCLPGHPSKALSAWAGDRPNGTRQSGGGDRCF